MLNNPQIERSPKVYTACSSWRGKSGADPGKASNSRPPRLLPLWRGPNSPSERRERDVTPPLRADQPPTRADESSADLTRRASHKKPSNTTTATEQISELRIWPPAQGEMETAASQEIDREKWRRRRRGVGECEVVGWVKRKRGVKPLETCFPRDLKTREYLLTTFAPPRPNK